jgi:GH15 family glucan-1,4-alpha-glucosidase
MARATTLGNGNVLVGFDYRGQVRDFYYPFVGHANHVSGASGNHIHRIGVFMAGEMAWFDDPAWEIIVGSDPDTLVGGFVATHPRLGVQIVSNDIVHNERNVLIRTFTVINQNATTFEGKLILSQQFRINESRRGDTGMFDPRVNAIVHYKGATTLLVNAMHEGRQFSEFNIGLFGIEGKEGTYHDANDGILEGNPIEHGSVDSVIAVPFTLEKHAKTTVDYWITCGSTIAEVHDLDAWVREETPAHLQRSTQNYWRAWTEKEATDLSLLGEELQTLYRRSLTTIRVHTDNRGAIIASSDTDMLHHGRDTYSYVWPRDGAIVAHALDVCGYSDAARRFFTFMSERLERDGYLMHKYRSDGALGSSWHPWVLDGEAILPIQEDETATVLYMLYQHYEQEKDLEYIESLYNPFIEPAADFMVSYMESRLGLPDNSFDLWEEKYGISTYTASSVFGALTAAAHFAQLLGKDEASRTYEAVAQRIRTSILEHLYDDDLGMFIKHIRAHEDRDDEYDRTVDSSSFFGPIYFGVIEPTDERITRAIGVIEERLRVRANSDGYIRYERDNYYTMHDAGSPNPWVVTTMWVAQYYVMIAQSVDDLVRVYELLEWTASHATPSGVLAEQMHPHTREHLSTAPLVWSHAEYVLTVQAYLKRHAELSQNEGQK